MTVDPAALGGVISRAETPTGEPPPEPTPDTRPRRKKREPITSLTEFFSRRAASPKAFLKDLREADKWRFDDDDIRAALDIHSERDKDFSRTTKLIASSVKERDARFARSVLTFGELAIRRRLAENPHSVGVDLDAIDDPADRLDRTARILSTRLSDSARRGEAANLLLSFALCLIHRGGLVPQAAVERLAVAVAEDSSRTSARQRSRLIWLGEHPKDTRAVVDLLAPSVRRAAELSHTVRGLEVRIGSERQAREAAEAEAVRLSTAVADLEKQLTDAKATINQLYEVSRAAAVHADHDVKRAKARIAGLLDGQLQDLVATIGEALSVDPPQVDVAQEKAAALTRELERQVEWLKS